MAPHACSLFVLSPFSAVAALLPLSLSPSALSLPSPFPVFSPFPSLWPLLALHFSSLCPSLYLSSYLACLGATSLATAPAMATANNNSNHNSNNTRCHFGSKQCKSEPSQHAINVGRWQCCIDRDARGCTAAIRRKGSFLRAVLDTGQWGNA